MISKSLFNRFYPNPDQYNGTLKFYGWVRAHIGPETVLLNLGAGPETKDRVRILKGEVAEVIGADIDPIVLSNSEMDRAVLIDEGRIPVNDSSIDVIVCDYVLEHVDKPGSFLSECARVLAPGGAMFFRTPNSLHYVSLFSRVTPHWVHTAIANRIRGLPEEAHDPWPTFYRLNRRGIIRKTAKVAGISHIELRMIEAEPSYLIFHWLPFLIGVAWERVVNLSDIFSGLRANIFGKLTK